MIYFIYTKLITYLELHVGTTGGPHALYTMWLGQSWSVKWNMCSEYINRKTKASFKLNFRPNLRFNSIQSCRLYI